jgi:hypothetical protein
VAGREGLRLAEADRPGPPSELRGLHKVDWIFVFSCAATTSCGCQD